MRKTKNNNVSGSTATNNNNNYYQPLQTLDDDNNEIIVTKTKKQIIPPLTILKCSIEKLHELCNNSKVAEYAIRKISIGLKLFCQTQTDVEKIGEMLKLEKFEFFTYATKSDRPYKALLFGLDKVDLSELKSKLISMGLDCIDCKMIQKSSQSNTQIIFYVVYFKRQTTTLKELRQKYASIDHLKVKWEFHRNRKNKVTQCYNCQMYGHGSSRCAVKIFCSICSGEHKAVECSSNILKCANCGQEHKSTSPDCPSRKKYIDMKHRFMNQNARTPRRSNYPNRQSNVPYVPNNSDELQFPALHAGETPVNKNWSNLKNNNTNDVLFSFDDIKNITLELIQKLKACKTKLDQFEVVSSIAHKFLS